MTYASSHRKGVSRRVWQTRQYYFQMLADALDTFAPDPDCSPRDNAADSLIYAMRLVGAAIEADEPKDPHSCPDESPSPPKPSPDGNLVGGCLILEDSVASAAVSIQIYANAPKT